MYPGASFLAMYRATYAGGRVQRASRMGHRGKAHLPAAAHRAAPVKPLPAGERTGLDVSSCCWSEHESLGVGCTTSAWRFRVQRACRMITPSALTSRAHASSKHALAARGGGVGEQHATEHGHHALHHASCLTHPCDIPAMPQPPAPAPAPKAAAPPPPTTLNVQAGPAAASP